VSASPPLVSPGQPGAPVAPGASTLLDTLGRDTLARLTPDVIARLGDDELAELLDLCQSETHDLSFREFIAKVAPRYAFYAHCERLIAVLQRVADGELKRVMVFMPPRHSKSETVSRLFPAYFLMRYPHQFVGVASYSADLAATFSRLSRERYLEIGGQLRADSSQIKHWETAQGGGMWAAGVGGPLTGKGFHCGIIDDPLKNADEARSARIRGKQVDWWQSTFFTRAEPDGAIIIVQTRWHEEDLSGYLLGEEARSSEDGESEGWHIVNMPAISEDRPREWPKTCTVEIDPRGLEEALCEERYPLDKLKRMRAKVGDYFWAALYQQRPSPSQGQVFRASDLCPEDLGEASPFWPWPENERIVEAYLSADTAVTARTKSDFTALSLGFLASDGYTYVYPLLLSKLEIGDVVRHIALLWAKWKARLGPVLRGIRIESGSAGTPAIQEARELLVRARSRPTDEQRIMAELARLKNDRDRSMAERDAMKLLVDSMAPSSRWEAREWEEVRAAPPLVLSPYLPGNLMGGGKGDIEARASEITPFVSGKNVRLCAESANAHIARAWLAQMLAMPNGAHDDAVQSTIGAVLPFVESVRSEDGETIDEELLRRAMGLA
jgi:hypothetical protein